ncbi:MAG: hypothetical protein EHM13_03805 [Acidobacteria bacterium]|nr:MAG: hypothetical protein EHM13_03805 [Acidobacteriota bacterium]
MRKHVDLAGVLYMLWGAMTLLLSVSLLSTGLAAAAIGASAGAGQTGPNLAAGLVAAAFFAVAGAGCLFGGAHLWVGSRVRRLRDWSRPVAIVLAIVDLVLVPFGTALGIYALWALLHDDSKGLFEH